MAYFLFIDESGQDHRASPYEVLAGIAVEDQDLWNLIVAIQELEERIFMRRYTSNTAELKGQKLLKRKVFRLAAQLPPIPEEERGHLARRCLENGRTAGKQEITALAQAKMLTQPKSSRYARDLDAECLQALLPELLLPRRHRSTYEKTMLISFNASSIF